MPLPSLFNCSNDMALAANLRQYRPPRLVSQMESDLSTLSRVWEDTPFAGPWGWSLATKNRYLRMGVSPTLLPSDEWLAEVRRLSSRQFACGYVARLLDELDDPRLLGHEMVWVAHGLGDVPRPGAGCPVIYKSPWSSSGRGVFVARGHTAAVLARLDGMVRAQGGYAADRFYENKAADFAMEFLARPGRPATFLGYSVFHAASHGAYGFNYVESQSSLIARIGAEADLLARLADYHSRHLALTAYRGPVGVDMLTTADGRLHPCVEINFRMNMGILALLLHDRHGEGATLALTPPVTHGFQARMDEGRLHIMYTPPPDL